MNINFMPKLKTTHLYLAVSGKNRTLKLKNIDMLLSLRDTGRKFHAAMLEPLLGH
jgi:hypothetical protein